MDLSDSGNLIRIPNLSSIAPNLTELNLSGCYKVKDCPEIPCNIRILKLDGTGIEQLPSSIKHLSQLEKLFLPNCSNLASLPESIKQLSNLKLLNLEGCERLKSLPGLPSCLELLDATNCLSLESASISFNFLEHDDENEETHKSESEDCKFLDFSNCVKLNKKVMEDVFEAHLLGQKVTLLMAGGEVPEWMRYKNKGSSLSFKLDLRHLIAFSFCFVLRPRGGFYFPRFKVDFICESGNRRERHAFNLFSDKWIYLDPLSHVLLSFIGLRTRSTFIELRTRFDEERFVKASFCFADEEIIMECGVHPIYSRDKRRSRNEKHQDDEECQSLLQILEDESKRRRINNEEEASSSS
ncbi:hypothetical protein GH714_022632 [Hevea brasiliensis]|uniref:C-JID domain-containing protein n=1 Tax=Hevea brasiliensis TaxID=3981 RepID=A0A6A6N6F0_HEVBR|nr:hypothetical protein GH714_022632 [Hevea brasiliensis]